MQTNDRKPFNSLTNFLDDDQLKAVTHRGSNLLIIAGAGSGKTHTLTHRAVSFLEEGVKPDELMVITFTKKAANELQMRIVNNVPVEMRKSLKRAWIGTIHSICWRMLMEYGEVVGLKPSWSVLDQEDTERVMYLSAKPYGFGRKLAKQIYSVYSYSRNSMTEWSDWVKTQRFPDVPKSPNVGKAIAAYQRRCRRSNRVDFDDLQILALKLLHENPSIREEYQKRFNVIMVDEYQDTNVIQAGILKLLATRENIVTVVGDDAQSIYGFRAATIKNILNFVSEFSADKVLLSRNYRSTPEIVALANTSIRNNRYQIPKEIHAVAIQGSKPLYYRGNFPRDEAEFVVQHIVEKQNSGIPINEIAVLFRSTRQAAAVQIELSKADIPFVVIGGEDFFKLEHIKVVLDMLRLLINPEDSIALGSLQDVIGFSSSVTLEKIEHQADTVQLSFWDIVDWALPQADVEQQADIESLIDFRRQIYRLQTSIIPDSSITPVITAVFRFLEPYLKRHYTHGWKNVREDYAILQSVAAQFTSLSDFLNSIALQQFVEDEDAEGKIVLSTIHSAKGLEWDTVFVIGLVEFWFPLNWAIQQTGTDEEERRLFYVAVTRAKNSLFLSSYFKDVTPYGNVKQQRLSRFIRELPRTVYELGAI